MSEPETTKVFARQPFAFTNNADLRIRVYENVANFGLVTIERGGTSNAMMLKSPQLYAYFTAAAEDIRIPPPGRPCRLNFIQVVERPGR
jgi:hypothetical protein